MKRRFNDGYYDVSVQEWEDERIPQVILNSRVTWIPTTAVVGWVAVGQFLSDRGWQFWLGYAASVFLVSSLFVLLEEVNENVRFVRRRLQNFRQAVREANAEISKYKQPANATAHDILDTIDGKWF